MTRARSHPLLATIMSLLFCAAMTDPARAIRPDEMLANPVLEARARAIGSELRCLVCQNESIDDSDADLAEKCTLRTGAEAEKRRRRQKMIRESHLFPVRVPTWIA